MVTYETIFHAFVYFSGVGFFIGWFMFLNGWWIGEAVRWVVAAIHGKDPK